MSDGFKYSVRDRYDGQVFKKDSFIHNNTEVCTHQDEFHIEWGRIVKGGFRRSTTFGINRKEFLTCRKSINTNSEYIGLD